MNTAQGDEYPRVRVDAPSPASGVPWYAAAEFRALDEVRRAFAKRGVPLTGTRTTEAGARQAVFWTLYELGYVLDELVRRTGDGTHAWCAVRASEHGPGRVLLDITIEPIPSTHTERGAP